MIYRVHAEYLDFAKNDKMTTQVGYGGPVMEQFSTRILIYMYKRRGIK